MVTEDVGGHARFEVLGRHLAFQIFRVLRQPVTTHIFLALFQINKLLLKFLNLQISFKTCFLFIRKLCDKFSGKNSKFVAQKGCVRNNDDI